MKTNNIIFFISLSKAGLSDLHITCNNILFSEGCVSDEIFFFHDSFCVSSFPFGFYDLVFKFESDNTYFYDLVKR